MARQQGGRGLSARSAAGPPVRVRDRPAPDPGPAQPGPAQPGTAQPGPAQPDRDDVRFLSVADAARESGASPSAVRTWVRGGQVRTRTGAGPRGERTEVALPDVEQLARAVSSPRGRRSAPEQAVASGGELVPMQTVEAMERLAGELYLAGQRAARAEAVAELRDRRLAALQQEVDDLQREATGLWEQNQELLRRVAVAEAQLVAQDRGTGGSRWRLRRSP